MKFYIEPHTSNDPMELLLFEHISQKLKYRVLWELRTLENETEDSEGMIILRNNYKLEVINFPLVLAQKIESALDAIDYSKW